jgi:patatin-like phospholipase/acyl hydrolase
VGLILPPAPPLLRGEREKRVLALTGGGMRGLFTAAVLAKIAEIKQTSIRGYFSAFAGTSIGGILAIGLATGVEPSVMRAAIRKHGPAIFRRRWWTRGWNAFDLFVSPYGQKPLRKAIEEILGAGAELTLEQIDVPLIVTAVEHNRAVAKVFASKPVARSGDDLSVKLIDVALATSAAPTFFPPHRIGDRVYLDGGLIANAPDMVAVQRCVERMGTRMDELHVLSVGTAAKRVRGDVGIGAPGRLGWLKRHELFEVTIESQADLAVTELEAFLGDRFCRIDASPEKKIALDDTAKTQLDELERLATEAVSDFRKNESDWSRFFADRAPGG